MPALEIHDLYKSYAAEEVLLGLDLSVEAGAFAAILGPSGSGKTTLLRVIAGFERADRGSVVLAGEVVEDATHYVEPDRRRIGYVSQDGSLFPHLCVEDNVGFGLARRDRHGARVRELIDMVGLVGFERRFPHELSGGQQQRVALARALAIEPALVLLDEPFSSLDARLRAAVRHDVREVLRVAGTTALLVTHDEDEALSLADHVAVISSGRIGQYDTPQGLYAHPISPTLARGLGETNFVHGVAAGTSVETEFGVLALAPGSGSDAAAGALVVLIRPEQLHITSDLAASPARARVLATEFYGHDALVRLRPAWASATELLVRTSDVASIPAPDSEVALVVQGAVVAWSEGTRTTR